jgi:L-ascorbate metabolism protein UlaG (beta-lactamase superfamily)
MLGTAPTLGIEWIGHATMLIQMNGKTILTDPVFSERVGVEVCGKVIGIERYTQPSRTLENIPKPDIIMLSHAHLDHTDLPTLRRFVDHYPEEICIVTAKNTCDIIEGLAWKSVHELDWDEDVCLSGINIRALQTQHNGWRLPWERDRARGYTDTGRSYNGYLLEGGGKKVVFGGDTAYIPHFTSLRNESIDVAIMPIGAYHGYETLHCTPEQALQMASEMRAEYFVPMHCATFDQSNEEPNEPLRRLLSAALRHDSRIALNRIGERFAL